jgi:hydroxypyruvate isomerase
MNRRVFGRTLAGAALMPLGGSGEHSLAAARGFPPGAGKSDPAGAGLPLPQAGEKAEVPFKISVMLWTVFGKLPFEERLEKVAAAGYQAVELVGEYSKWSDEEYRRMNEKKRSLGITFDTIVGGTDLADLRKRDKFLSDIRNGLATADKLECPAMICLSGNEVPGMTRSSQHESLVEGLKRAAEVVQGKGITLLLENIDPEENPHYYLSSVAEGFKIIGEVNHPQVKFLYDFYHEQIAEGNLIEKLVRNIDKVGLVHIADVPGRHEPGTGEINYPNIYKKLAELKYSHYVAMEFIPTGDPVETLQRAREEALSAARA